MKSQPDAGIALCEEGPKAEHRSWLLHLWPTIVMMLFIPAHAIPAEHQLDSITVEAKRKEREELRLQIDQFVETAVVHRLGESLMRWDTRICPLVAGLPRDQGEFMLQRLSQAVRDAGAPLAPEKCAANLFVLVSSQAEQILEEIHKKKPGFFDTSNGVGGLQHFLRTERPVRVWYNWGNQGDAAGGLFIVAAFIGSTGGSMGGATGTPSPSAAGADFGTYRMPNSRLSLTVTKSIKSAIIIVDLPRMKNINVGQLSAYIAMVGLAEINLDRMVVSAPSILRLFSEPPEAPVDGMSPWDQALLKSLYSTRAQSVMQVSDMETQMVDSIAPH